MIINKNSWHYKLMLRAGSHPEWRPNLCSYVRGLVSSLMLTLLFSCLFTGFIISTLTILTLPLFTNDAGISIISGAVWILVGVVAIRILREENLDTSRVLYKKQNKTRVKDPSLFKAWWQGFKDKTCIKVDFK